MGFCSKGLGTALLFFQLLFIQLFSIEKNKCAVGVPTAKIMTKKTGCNTAAGHAPVFWRELRRALGRLYFHSTLIIKHSSLLHRMMLL
jgi:hypothetical protein